ncbi:response regulator receiver domain protein (CheY-like) [Aurantiacibacter atlanticus]|uniref:Response regulator receiver domain protein (CheY-like) n=1 Tax=Aurantiacibacter atlanticus TaxID=1648404 RepID=A0A0H4VJN0_9SPHN|nr:response regulator [Aurantiacibacter atlanticus]AKQ43184.2 response regulator receiver domain protein (CheY-like) [Aurantiacibacter atlanticus]
MKSAKAKQAPNVTGKKLGRVLLVEDDPVLAMMLEDAFLQAGASEVVICATMQATVKALDDARPDAIVLDVHLADRNDGWAIAEVVTMLGPTPPRIAFSTGSPQDIPPAIAEMGPIFEKPYDPQALVAELSAGRKRGLFSRFLG